MVLLPFLLTRCFSFNSLDDNFFCFLIFGVFSEINRDEILLL